MKEIPYKKLHSKIEIAFEFTWKILHKLIGPWKKKYKRIPFKFDMGSFYREILCIFLQKNSL